MKRSLLLIPLLLFSTVIFANVVTVGNTYAIAESDFLQVLLKRAREFEEKGQWQVLKERWRENIRRKADRPTPTILPQTKRKRSFSFDPTITLAHDLTDQRGQVFAKAGNKINPLNYMTLNHPFLFIDGDKKSNVDFAKRVINKNPQFKIILIAGSVASVSKELRVPIYFDQEARLIHKFNIEHVPALITANHDVLEISEEVA